MLKAHAATPLNERLRHAIDLAREGDLDAALAQLSSDPDPEQASSNFAALTRFLYREARDCRAMVASADAGVRFELQAAEACAVRDPDRARTLWIAAKVLAFNAAANCWPGWGEEGFAPGPADIREGLRLARLSRDLVTQLELGDNQLGNAHWLVGALELAAGDDSSALAAFARAREAFEAAGGSREALMARGYSALALKRGIDTRTGAEEELARAVAALEQDGSEEALFFVEQLRTADRILNPSPETGAQP